MKCNSPPKLIITWLCLVLALQVVASTSIPCSGPDDEEDENDDDVHPPNEDHLNRELRPTRCKRSRQQYRTFVGLEKGGVVSLDCGRCLVSDVQVKVSHGSDCVGRTPELFASKLNCMWKNSCKLEYTPSPILTPGGHFDCLLRTPNKMDVGYSCVNPKKTPIVDVISLTSVEASRGLVRSHDRTESDDYPTDSLQPRSHTLTVRPPSNAQVTYALVKTLTFDLVSGDTLTMSSCPVTISMWTRPPTPYHHNITGQRLQFDVNLGPKSPGLRGFDICFQWFLPNDTKAVEKFSETVKLCEERIKRRPPDDFPVYDVIKAVTSRFEKGIVRSHAHYPWNYKPLSHKPRLETLMVQSWDTVYRKLVAPADKKLIRVTVKNMSLARRDSLQVFRDNGETVDDLDGQSIPARSLLLQFNVTNRDPHSPTGQGFLLHYQWLSWEEDKLTRVNLQANICIKRPHRRVPNECRMRKTSKSGGKKKKKQRREKKKRKKSKKKTPRKKNGKKQKRKGKRKDGTKRKAEKTKKRGRRTKQENVGE